MNNNRNNSQVLFYQTADGKSRIEVKLEDETVWLSHGQMAELFETTKQNVGMHIKNIFNKGELIKDSVVKESFTTANDGKQYKIAFYNLAVVISVSYRIKSQRGTQFRIWATPRLKEYLIKGFA